MGEFEQIPEIAERIKRSKMELQDNGNYWTPEWDSQSCCDQDFVNNFKKGWQHQQAIINEHTEVIKLQDTDLRKYEKQIESLKEQLNNMEQCYIGKKKECEDQLNQTKDACGRYDRLYEEYRLLELLVGNYRVLAQEVLPRCSRELLENIEGWEKALRGANA